MSVGNHLEIIAILYLVFAFFALAFVVQAVIRRRKLSIMDMCSAMYILALCVLPAFIFLGYADGVQVTNSIDFGKKNVWTFYVQLILTIIGYLFLHFGYRIKRKDNNTYDAPVSASETLPVSVIFTVISLISLFLWASGYGGIASLIIYANQIRASFIISSNSYAFFKHFVPLSLLASWMLFNSLIKKETKGIFGKIGVILLLVCDVALSFIYILANDGRLLLVVYVFLFFLLYFKQQYEVKKVSMLRIALKFGVTFIFVILILFNADAILQMMRNGTYEKSSSSGLMETLSKEFAFITSGVQSALLQDSSGQGKLMIVNDIVNGAFAWLPSSWKPMILEDVWDYNTRLISSGGYGQAPTSIIAQSVYDLSYLGIIVIPFLYGMIIKRVEMALDKRKGNVFYDTIYVVLAYCFCKGIPYFSIYNIMINIFFVFIAVLIYHIVRKVKIRE